jgi:hypothetical protein
LKKKLNSERFISANTQETMLTIYVVYHNTLEDTNVFFLSLQEARDSITQLAQETETDVSEWNIRRLREGVKFGGDLTEFSTSENSLCQP